MSNKIFIALSWISIFVIMATVGVPAGKSYSNKNNRSVL